MACDNFCTFFNEIHYLFGFSMNSNLFLALVGLLDAGMLW